MNIKLKASLITAAIPLIAFALVYAIVQFPLVLLLIVLGGLLWIVYRAVLNYLEFQEKYKQKVNNRK